ncbi:hypothetical protein [Phocaeicola sp.]
MKNKLKQIIIRPDLKRRMGDFICNFTAVVLGILLTFAGTDWIEERKTENEVKKALSLVRNEMLINREYIKEMMEDEVSQQRGALYLLQYKDSLHKTSPDSLEKYCNFSFQSQGFLYINDAMEMLKTSSLMPAISDKELVTQIIKTYNTIKTAFTTFDDFTDTKIADVSKLIEQPEVQEFLDKNENYSPAELWNVFFKFPGGIQTLRLISSMHSNPTQIYGHYLKQIDNTVAAIDKIYKRE